MNRKKVFALLVVLPCLVYLFSQMVLAESNEDALFGAVKNNDLRTVQQLLKKGNDMIMKRNLCIKIALTGFIVFGFIGCGTTQTSSNTSGKGDTRNAIEDSNISNYMQRKQVEQIQRDSQAWNQIRNSNTSFNQSMQYQTRQNYNQNMQNYKTQYNRGFK